MLSEITIKGVYIPIILQMSISLTDAEGKKLKKTKTKKQTMLAYIRLMRKAVLSNCPLIVSPRLE